MNDTLQILFGLLGGLAVFIFGMNMMSECLQKAAGEKMKSILELLTKNPVMGVLAGALTTAVLQCDDSYGDRVRKRGTDEPAAVHIDYTWRKHRDDNDCADHRV